MAAAPAAVLAAAFASAAALASASAAVSASAAALASAAAAAFAFPPASLAANGSAGAPLGASASSSRLTACSCWRRSSLTTGYRGSISTRVCTITPAAQTRANHLWSAGITYHGAQRVLVADSISENAFW